MTEFGEYLRAKEPERRERAQNWRTAIGLQQVDGLTTSEYLRDTARRNIEGEIGIDEAGRLIAEYYKSKPVREVAAKTRTDEADIVSQRIAALLAEPAFVFSPEELVSIHRRLFAGIYKFAGRYRDYNITKDEWVLGGDTVQYASCYRLAETLAFDFGEEKRFSYGGLDVAGTIRHIAKFVSGIWQIHAFGEGNTRTTAVFTIKYLRSLGFDADNELFAKNAFYFRNALVRANYTNIPKGIGETTEYLELFFRNLLLGETNELKSRHLHIRHHAPASNPASNPASDAAVLSLSNPVRRLVVVLHGEMSRAALMRAVGIRDRVSFANSYLNPALRAGLVEMTQPASPRSPTQRYRLTAAGAALKPGMTPDVD